MLGAECGYFTIDWKRADCKKTQESFIGRQARPSRGRVDWNNVTVTHIRISRISARHCCQDTLSLPSHTSYRQAQNLRSIANRAHDTKFLAREATAVSCQVVYEHKSFLLSMIKSIELLDLILPLQHILLIQKHKRWECIIFMCHWTIFSHFSLIVNTSVCVCLCLCVSVSVSWNHLFPLFPPC